MRPRKSKLYQPLSLYLMVLGFGPQSWCNSPGNVGNVQSSTGCCSITTGPSMDTTSQCFEEFTFQLFMFTFNHLAKVSIRLGNHDCFQKYLGCQFLFPNHPTMALGRSSSNSSTLRSDAFSLGSPGRCLEKGC